MRSVFLAHFTQISGKTDCWRRSRFDRTFFVNAIRIASRFHASSALLQFYATKYELLLINLKPKLAVKNVKQALCADTSQ